MSEIPGQTPPIIKKIKKGGGGHHGGAWKVAYADFVTAMMALFIVLWVLSSGDQVKKAVAEYFRDPRGIELGKGKSILPNQGNIVSSPEIKAELLRREEEKEKFEQMGQEILTHLKQEKGLEKILEQVKIEYTEEGMRIELIESTHEAFFEVGTSQLNPRAFTLLKYLGSQLSSLQNQLIIEGHTDSRPYDGSGMGYTNYELSSDRANSARRVIVLGGVNNNQIMEIRGFADKKLKNIDNPFDVINRRVSIIVTYSEKK
jgi:chemotaxis protein MotB